ncbi:MAG: GGDEF domain-containing protein [Leptospiraceae bacterium]|nr:GGDEF domain-containing protein [Leptospiraceae bacterium]
MSSEELERALWEKEKELERLKTLLGAYEKVTDLSRRELVDADQTIQAQEVAQELSRAEIIGLQNQVKELETGNADLVDLIRQILDEDPLSEDRILKKFEELRDRSDNEFYVDIFRVLLHHRFEPGVAQDHWKEILQHARTLERKLERPIGFRVAMLDYFINLNKILRNPIVIEISVVDEMMKNSMTDELTMLYNRRYFDRCLRREMKRAERHQVPVSLLVLDLDDFKQINDNYGHSTGDMIMRKVGQILKLILRQEDYPCRFGGEEFAVVLPHTTPEQAGRVAERFREATEKEDFNGVRVTCSGGLASFPEHGSSGSEIFERADRALYEAKKAGKNRIILAS